MKLKNRFIGGSVLSYNNLKGLFYPFLAITIFTFMFGLENDAIKDGYIPSSTDVEYYNSLPQEAFENYIGSRDLGLVAILQDGNAWGSTSWQDVLSANNISYTIISLNNLAGLDYSAYDMIISASDGQVNERIYNAADDIIDYVDNGGIAVISLCSQGQTGDFGGLVTTMDYPSTNSVVDPDHPLMSGVSSPFSGTSPSHTTFSSVPDGFTVLATSDGNGQPTAVVKGGLFVHGLTLEFGYNYNQGNKPITENAISWGMNTE